MSKAERLYRKSVGWAVRVALWPVLASMLVAKVLLEMLAAASLAAARVGATVEEWEEGPAPEWRPVPRDEALDEEE